MIRPIYASAAVSKDNLYFSTKIIRTCKHCKYYRPDTSYSSHQTYDYGLCIHPKFVETYKETYLLRSNNNMCGTIAKYFEEENIFISHLRYLKSLLYVQIIINILCIITLFFKILHLLYAITLLIVILRM